MADWPASIAEPARPCPEPRSDFHQLNDPVSSTYRDDCEPCEFCCDCQFCESTRCYLRIQTTDCGVNR